MNNSLSKIPNMPDSLAFSYSEVNNLNNTVAYILNEKLKNETVIVINEPSQTYSNTIIEQREEFTNGFKVVRLSNNQFGYIREYDNKLLPYRYDLAFDFNEYGFAMMAKSSYVTWINKDFKCLDFSGNFVSEEYLSAWSKIHNFSKGKHPLSRLYNGNVVYLDTTGHLKTFYKYNNDNFEDEEYKYFLSGSPFDDSGFAIIDRDYLLSSGYYIKNEDLLNIMKEKGLFDIINEEVKEKHLTLKR